MNISNENPYLSFVMISRNDDYGGNTLQRMQVSINGRLEQLEKYRIESELILMEWNPPPDRPLLKDVISWPENLQHCTIRIVEVPPDIHRRYEYSDRLNINAVVSINSGIRRARGQWVLPGNIDLLYSDELMRFIASKQLNRNERYRIDRTDVDRHVVQHKTLEEQLEYCKNNIIRVHGYDPSARRKFERFRRPFPILHTNASGDFQLLSREWWHKLHGYNEIDIISAFADSILCYASYAAGVKEVVLKQPMRFYHIDHDNKFNDRKLESPLPGEKILLSSAIPAGLSKKLMSFYQRFLFHTGYHFESRIDGIPTLPYLECIRMCQDMLSGKRPYIFNDENWGLGRESLEEFVINRADWDRDYGRE